VMTPPQLEELRDILSDEQEILTKRASKKPDEKLEEDKEKQRIERQKKEREAREKAEAEAEKLLADW